MSAPHTSFEACSQCPDEDLCWYKGFCLLDGLYGLSKIGIASVNNYANACIKADQIAGPRTIYPGPYHPTDSMPDGRNMASTEKDRKD